MSKFVRQSSGSLQALLAVLASRDAAADRAVDRSMRQQQLALQLEEIRGNASLKKEELELDKLRFQAQLDAQKMQLDLALGRQKLEGARMKLETRQLTQSMKIAAEAHRMNTRLSEANLRRLASEEERQLVTMLREGQERSLRMATEVMDGLEDGYRREGDEARSGMMHVFGVQGADADGNPIFVPHPVYRDVMDRYAVGAGLSTGKEPTDYQRVVSTWINGAQGVYRALAGAKLEEINATLPEGEKLSSIEDLSPVVRAGLTRESMRDYFTGARGVLFIAARGAMGDDKFQELAKKHGDSPKFYAAVMSGFRYMGGASGVRWEGPNKDGSIKDVAMQGLDLFVNDMYGKGKGVLDQALPMGTEALIGIESVDEKRRGFMKQAFLYDQLATGEEHAIMKGQYDGMTDVQRAQHKANIYSKLKTFDQMEEQSAFEGNPPMAGIVKGMVDDLADPQNTVDLLEAVDKVGPGAQVEGLNLRSIPGISPADFPAPAVMRAPTPEEALHAASVATPDEKGQKPHTLRNDLESVRQGIGSEMNRGIYDHSNRRGKWMDNIIADPLQKAWDYMTK